MTTTNGTMAPNGSGLDLLKSERGIVTILIIVAATVLVALDKMLIDLWMQTTLGIGGIYVVGKSATGWAEATARGRVAVIQESAKSGVPVPPESISGPTVNVVNQPSAPVPVDGTTTTSTTTTNTPTVSRTPSRGLVHAHLMVAIAAIGFIIYGLTSGCSGTNKPSSKLVGDLVDCTTEGARAAINEWAPVLDALLHRSTTNDGKLDREAIKASAANLGIQTGACALAAVFKRAMDGRPASDAPMSSPLQVDKEELRAAFEEVRAASFGGKRFRVEGAEL